MRRWVVGWFVVLVVAFVLVGCSGDDDDAGDPTPTPVGPVSEWEVQDPEDQGMDPAGLEEAREYAFAEGRHTQGVVVVRNGVIVGEWYDEASGADQDSWAASWSMAKSFTSALVGIAIEEGAIPSVDEPMTTYYPEWEGTPREDVTLRDVLQMASGLDFEESYDPGDVESSDIIQMVVFQRDQLAYAAGRPQATEPGTTFSYSSGDTMLLSGMLEQATGMQVGDYAREKLFDPLGIEQAEWWEDAEGHTLTYCCVDTTSRGFARFGWLYLQEGASGDEQLVPADWVADSLTPSEFYDGYGYQWWLIGNTEEGLPPDTFAAQGHDGQFIYVIPSLDLVVVRNGTYVKHEGEPVADPNLFELYPDTVVPERGTRAPENGWGEVEFLTPIVESIESGGSGG